MADNTEVEVQDGALQTGTGSTTIENTVVSKIAGLAAREVSGVYALGGNTERVVANIRETFGGSTNVRQGVSVDVTETDVTVDISIVAEYGVAIQDLGEAIRQNIIDAVESMTGLDVRAVNVTVYDVHVEEPEDESEQPELTQAR